MSPPQCMPAIPAAPWALELSMMISPLLLLSSILSDTSEAQPVMPPTNIILPPDTLPPISIVPLFSQPVMTLKFAAVSPPIRT